MKRSTERILTTHTGSLPRPDGLVELMFAKEEGREVDAHELPRERVVGDVLAVVPVRDFHISSFGVMNTPCVQPRCVHCLMNLPFSSKTWIRLFSRSLT